MRRLFVLLTLVSLLWGCRRWAAESPKPTATPKTFVQWAVEAEASSSFGYPDWSERRAVGAPDVEACVDDSRAWASGRGNGVEWLTLTYARPVHATEVRIYQTFGRGAVSRISLIDEEGNRNVVWEGVDDAVPCPGVLSVIFPPTPYRVVKVRVDLDESRTGFWNEIDAVALVGIVR